MAASAANWAWANSRASNGSLLVLMAIAFEIDDKGNCIVTVAELAGKARLSERAVQSATVDLTGLGELTVTPRAEGHRNGYALSMPRGADSAPLLAGSPADSAPPQILHPAESAPLKQEAAGKSRGAESAPLKIPDAFSSSVVSGKRSSPKDMSGAPRPDVERICQHLADRIEGNGSKRPEIGKRWNDAARLMLDKDGLTEQQVHDAIDWSQQHHFWHRNILSMEKLRHHMDRLRLDWKAEREKAAGRKPSGGRPTPDDDYAAALERIHARKENANGTGGNSHDSPARQVGLPPAANRRHHLRDLAPRHRRTRFRRRPGRRHRHRPLGAVLLGRRHHP